MEKNDAGVVSFYKTPVAQVQSILQSEEVGRHFNSIKDKYERYSNKENNLDIKRIRRFVKHETGISVNCNVYVINEGGQENLTDELKKMGASLNLDGETHGMYDPSTNSVLVFNDKSPVVHMESIVVHEMIHSIGYKSQLVESKNKSLRYISKRSGLAVAGEKDYGESFEEGLAEHYAVKYRRKFADTGFFAELSKHMGRTVHGFYDIGGKATLSFRDTDATFDLPTGYLSVDSESIHSNLSQIFAYVFDLMNDAVYKKTDQNLEVLSLNAKRNPSRVKDLGGAIDAAIGKGTYLRFQKILYSEESVKELAEFADIIKKSAG